MKMRRTYWYMDECDQCPFHYDGACRNEGMNDKELDQPKGVQDWFPDWCPLEEVDEP